MTKTIRNDLGVTVGVLAALCAGMFSGCATRSDGDGSESHFVACNVDSECSHLGASYRCVDKQCSTTSTGGREGGSGDPNAGGTVNTGGTGGSVSGGGAGSGGADNSGGETVSCPPSLYYPVDGGPEGVSPPGYVDGGIYGCHVSRETAPAGWMPARAPDCVGTNNRCIYAPSALPCGACNSGDTCSATIEAVCDCGQGPIIDRYWDGWGCRCENGTWDCRLVSVSGASCQVCSDMCVNETRSSPYSTGMVAAGPTGVTIALSSTPAPPHLGDNDWTLTVKDSAGHAIEGATLTAAQLMVDHGHPGAKAIVIAEVGGGVYDAKPVNFNMPGYWETTIEVKKGSLDEKVVIKLCVQ